MRRKRGVLSSRMLLGSIIEPIGFLPNGTPLFPIAGSTGPNDDLDEDEDEEEEEEDGEDEDESKKDESKKEPPKRRAKSKETPEQKIRRLNAENKARREAEEEMARKLREYEDKDKSELELAVRDRDEAKQKLAELEASNKDMGFELAFLRLSVEEGYRWDDAEYVMHKLRKQGLEIVDGEVEELADAVKELVKSKPSLLKAEDDDERPTRTTGTNPRTSRRKKANGAQEQARLAEKYQIGNLIPFA